MSFAKILTVVVRGSPISGRESAEFLELAGMYLPATFKNPWFCPVNPNRTILFYEICPPFGRKLSGF
jgi:hypothetical protein